MRKELESMFKALLDQHGWSEKRNEYILWLFNYLLDQLKDRQDILVEMQIIWNEKEENIVVYWMNKYHTAKLLFKEDILASSYTFYDEYGESFASGVSRDGTYYGPSGLIISFISELKYYFVPSPEYSKNFLHKRHASFKEGLEEYLDWKEGWLERYEKPATEADIGRWTASFRELWFQKELDSIWD